MRREDEEARDAANANALIEWGGPIFMAFLGIVMLIVAGTILANRSDGLINPPLLIGVTLVFLVCVAERLVARGRGNAP